MGAAGVTVWQRKEKPSSLPDPDGKQLIFPENNVGQKKTAAGNDRQGVQNGRA